MGRLHHEGEIVEYCRAGLPWLIDCLEKIDWITSSVQHTGQMRELKWYRDCTLRLIFAMREGVIPLDAEKYSFVEMPPTDWPDVKLIFDDENEVLYRMKY